jgi:uncharacterized protein (TIGR02246 family)
MRKSLSLAGVAAIAVCLSACSDTAATSTNHDADVQALKDNEAQWNKDFGAKDADKIVAHYSDDAVLMNGGMPASNGKDAIRTTIKDMVSDPALSLKFQATQVEVAKAGDIGYTHGNYQMTMTDPHTKQVINDKGTYITVYKKQADGSWKAVQDAAISEVPPPMPEPEKTAAKKKK